MRLLHLSALASSLLVAGAAALRQDGPVFLIDEPNYRMDCDDLATVRPSDEEIWDRVAGVEMPLSEVEEIVQRATENRGFDDFRILSCELVMVGKPYYFCEVLTKRFNEKKDKTIWQRYEARIGLIRREVKFWMPMYRFPGTPPVGPVETLPSGVMTTDIRPGDGAEVREDSVVRCQYQMALLDGTLVYDTYKQKAPQVFRMSHAPVAGLREGLLGARANGKRKIVVPPELGYGEQGLPGVVPPNATLVFDLEVKEVQ